MKYVKGLQLLSVMIEDAFTKCDSILQKYDKVMISVSGGSDSDIVVDMVCRLGYAEKCVFVFFDTGIEYQATKNHLTFLENKYGIKVERVRPKNPVPRAVLKNGVPFLTKYVAQMIGAVAKRTNNLKLTAHTGVNLFIGSVSQLKLELFGKTR